MTIELTPRYGQHWYRVTGYDDLLPSVTTVLKIAELLHGREPDIPDPLVPAVRGALAFVRDYQLEMVASEVSIWHPQHHYAGTVDLVARNKAGELVVADWKRSKGLYPEHAYQVAGYAKAVNHLHGGTSKACVVRLPLRQDEHYEFRKVDIEPAFQVYLAAQALWWATKEEVWQ